MRSNFNQIAASPVRISHYLFDNDYLSVARFKIWLAAFVSCVATVRDRNDLRESEYEINRDKTLHHSRLA
jgi:hypothetical protein